MNGYGSVSKIDMVWMLKLLRNLINKVIERLEGGKNERN